MQTGWSRVLRQLLSADSQDKWSGSSKNEILENVN